MGEDENQEASEEAQEMKIVRKKRTKQEMKMKKKRKYKKGSRGRMKMLMKDRKRVDRN